MKKTFSVLKKGMSILLTATLLCGSVTAFPAMADEASSAEEATTGTTEDGLAYEIDENNKCVTITYYTGSATEVAIPEKIAGYSVTSIGDGAFGGCSSLTSITIPDGVKYIGILAFGGCSSLTSVTISDGVERIGDYAFMECSSLTSITIPDSVERIGDYTFFDCSNLTIFCYEDSYAYQYATGKGIPVSLLTAQTDEPTETPSTDPSESAAPTESVEPSESTAPTESETPSAVPTESVEPSETPNTITYGDVNEDTKIGADDALLVLRNVVGLTALSESQTTAADVDGEAGVKAGDALYILKYVVKLIDKFPVETAGK